ncbi:MAG TPA: phosphoenolpyruvate synthase [Gammaproteobacteria bacterium]|nr:phosphoenolpyruvate synthase [Gammaproteobacteria bacterium]
MATAGSACVVALQNVRMRDVPRVGGKNASLGELIQGLGAAGVRVPGGFATTVSAYWEFLAANDLKKPIDEILQLYAARQLPLEQAGDKIRALILQGQWPDAIAGEIRAAYRELRGNGGREATAVAVRSSATAEDLPEASFAGQQETFLNVRGEEALLAACRRCFASLFTDRAISYRENQGIDQTKVALSVGVQRMVRADLGAAGVMFSIDTETGFPRLVVISANWGLGETVVQGSVDPDEYRVFKPLLEHPGLKPVVERRMGGKEQKLVYGTRADSPTRLMRTRTAQRDAFVLDDEEILQLARWAVQIEAHYGKAMDMEWAKDGRTGELFVVQARPETVQSRRQAAQLKTYKINSKGRQLLAGVSVGDAVATGSVCRLHSAAEIDRFEAGSILVTGMTDPDWVPIMKRAAALVTDHGGRTSHAAIVSRELGLPALVGTGTGTQVLQDHQEVTVSCAEGDVGFVYEGIADYEVQNLNLENVERTRTEVMLNLGNPAAALRWWQLPADGVGLARIEFIISHDIKIHPLALIHPDRVLKHKERAQIARLTRGWADKHEYFVAKLAYGIARIAASQFPKPVIVRTSDFKTNEYAGLLGGAGFEPEEQNPMLGWRGASRYYSDAYREGFALECRALSRVRDEMGFANVIVMIPFCRTPAEADRVLETMAEQGLARGQNGLQVYVMCEIPSNVILAEQFAERFDGFSIGSNDLTQLVLGVDRDSASLKDLFDEQNEAVTRMIQTVIEVAHSKGRKVGLCGQGPSDRPEFVKFLIGAGIDSVSVTPDSFLRVKRNVADAERSTTAARAAQIGQARYAAISS